MNNNNDEEVDSSCKELFVYDSQLKICINAIESIHYKNKTKWIIYIEILLSFPPLLFISKTKMLSWINFIAMQIAKIHTKQNLMRFILSMQILRNGKFSEHFFLYNLVFIQLIFVLFSRWIIDQIKKIHESASLKIHERNYYIAKLIQFEWQNARKPKTVLSPNIYFKMYRCDIFFNAIAQ